MNAVRQIEINEREIDMNKKNAKAAAEDNADIRTLIAQFHARESY